MSAVPWLVIGWLCVAAGATTLVASWLAATGKLRVEPQPQQQSLALTGTIVLALGVFAAVAGMLLGGAGTSDAQALQTGGLAAASVVALYGLWLNDRRRRVDEERQSLDAQRTVLDDQRFRLEEGRQELDRQRAADDRGRTADERFARALELLGHDADQVRVGALHALAGLARNRPEYTQTTLDILCAYLRRPYDHASYAERRRLDTEPAAERTDDLPQDIEADRERQVRLAAQRLIVDLLPSTSDLDAPQYNLDLTGAALEYFDLSHKRLGTFTARSAHFYEAVSFEGTWFHGPMWLTWAHLWGESFRANDMVCQGISWWSNFTASGPVDFDRTQFRGETKFAYAIFADRVSFQHCRFATTVDFQHADFLGELNFAHTEGLIGRTTGMLVSLLHDVRLPDGWQVDSRDNRQPGRGLVRA
ncbi:MAG TPA: pentapeptide repeat-containing protein [Pseudonocardiaceae bacterium]|nr:pentapeptide repeat-containing protein [Pseudonocardiaceae bacterium]